VVGDACTDGTAAVVASFGDPRIRFVNLEVNTGHQSGPNNAGFGLARSALIAMLHHDDLWLPDHLDRMIATQRRTGADLVFALMELVAESGARYLAGAAPDGRYEPWIYCVTSSLLFKKDLVAEIGPWRHYREMYDSPTTEWLLRAHRAGKRMSLSPQLTVVGIPSRTRSYAEHASLEQEAWFKRIRDEPEFRETELAALAVRHAAGDAAFRQSLAVGLHLRRAARNAVLAAAMRLGITPGALSGLLTSWRKGGAIDTLRAQRGLPPAVHPGRTT
jgi:hypothetical protein